MNNSFTDSHRTDLNDYDYCGDDYLTDDEPTKKVIDVIILDPSVPSELCLVPPTNTQEFWDDYEFYLNVYKSKHGVRPRVQFKDHADLELHIEFITKD